MSDLTDEQIDAQTSQVERAFIDAMCEAGDDFNETAASFQQWIAAIEARAARRERERIIAMCDRYRARLYADEQGREATKPSRDALSWVTAKLRAGDAR